MYSAISTNVYCKYLNVRAQLISRKILMYKGPTEMNVSATGCAYVCACVCKGIWTYEYICYDICATVAIRPDSWTELWRQHGAAVGRVGKLWRWRFVCTPLRLAATTTAPLKSALKPPEPSKNKKPLKLLARFSKGLAREWGKVRYFLIKGHSKGFVAACQQGRVPESWVSFFLHIFHILFSFENISIWNA